jgi:hypothetical protein
MKFTFPKDYTADQIKAFFATLGDPNVRTFIALPEDKDLEIMGAAGKVLDPSLFTDIALRSISMGSGIPKQKLEGTEAGAITGSEVNQREYYKYVSDQQKLYEAEIIGPLIDMMMAIGQIQPDVDYRVEWANAFQLDPKTEAETELIQAQSDLILLKYMTMDEVREKRGKKPLKDVTSGKEDGQRLLSLLELQTKATAGVGTGFGVSLNSVDMSRLALMGVERKLGIKLQKILHSYHTKEIDKTMAQHQGKQSIEDMHQELLRVARDQLKQPTLPIEITTRLVVKRDRALSDFAKVLDETPQTDEEDADSD